MKQGRIKFVLICLAICLLLSSFAWADDHPYTCTGTNDQTGVSAAIATASSGDSVTISGNCAFSAPVYLTNKNIEVRGPTCTYDSNGLVTSCPTTIKVSGSGGGCTQLSPVLAFCFSTTTGTTDTSSAGLTVKKVSWSLHDMIITGTSSGQADVIGITSSGLNYPVQGWRIHHIKMDFSSSGIGGGRLITPVGIQWGLIDHTKFLSYSNIVLNPQGWLNSEYDAAANAGIRPYQSLEGSTSWGLPLHLGSDEALYVEDSSFTFTSTANNPIVNDAVAGISFVFRHNTVTTGTVYSHTGEGGLIGRGGMRKFEIYNNKFTGSGVNGPITFQENGTGVIYNNTISGYATNNPIFGLYRASLSSFNYTGLYYGNCWGSANQNHSSPVSYDGNIESTGWPCLDQIGRGSGVPLGTRQPSVPVYIWNNGPQMNCSTGSGSPACDGNSNAVSLNDTGLLWKPLSLYINTTGHTNGDKDYCIGTTIMPSSCGNHTNTYAPYAYPHPLQAGGSAALPPPRNLRTK